jgi:hypothetical protein
VWLPVVEVFAARGLLQEIGSEAVVPVVVVGGLDFRLRGDRDSGRADENDCAHE